MLRGNVQGSRRAEEVQAAAQVHPGCNYYGRIRVICPYVALRAGPAAAGHTGIGAYDGRGTTLQNNIFCVHRGQWQRSEIWPIDASPVGHNCIVFLLQVGAVRSAGALERRYM